jgi:hypothetical protein
MIEQAAAVLLLAIGISPGTPTRQGIITGQIVTMNGRPIAHARVWLEGKEPKRLEAQSDAGGRYKLRPVEPVYRYPYDLLVEAAGFARQYVPTVTVYAGVETELGRITLAPGRRYFGIVLDTDGKPRTGAELCVTIQRRERGYNVKNIGRPYQLTTDQSGRFGTPMLSVGEMLITVRAAGRRMVVINKMVPPGGGNERLDPVRLENDVPIQGVVHDEHGQPVPGAEAHIFGEVQAVTDSLGHFTIRGFGPKPTFQLILGKPGYVYHNHGYQDVEKLDVTLSRRGWISGRALDAETGRPVRIRSVMLCQFERQPNGEIVRRG